MKDMNSINETEEMTERTEKEIKMLYKENVQRTVPDMEKLWNRIESAIDETANNTETAQTEDTAVREIRPSARRISFTKIAAAAAAFLLVIGAGTFAFTRMNSSVKNSETSDKVSGQSAAAESITAAENTAAAAEGGEVASPPAIPDAAEQNEKQPAENKTKEEKGETNNVMPDKTGYENKSSPGPDTAKDEEPTREYENTEEAAAESTEQISEDSVLKSTMFFIRARIESADTKTADSCIYTVSIEECFTKDLPELLGGELISRRPLDLREGKSYLMPVYTDGSGIHPVIDSEPQIEVLKEDGKLIFPRFWTTLAEGAETLDSGMLSAPIQAADKLIDKWLGM